MGNREPNLEHFLELLDSESFDIDEVLADRGQIYECLYDFDKGRLNTVVQAVLDSKD